MDFLFPIDMLPLVVSYMDSVHFLVQTNLASLDSASTASSTCNENAPLLPATYSLLALHRPHAFWTTLAPLGFVPALRTWLHQRLWFP